MGSSSMVEHLFLVQKVVGSSPTFPTIIVLRMKLP
jgi:hypothetical protein